MTYSKEQLKAAHKHCSRNHDAINNSTVCGCFYCCQTFPATEVQKYTYPDDALCPKCGIDSVLADQSGLTLDKAFLEAMYQYWFDTDAEAEVEA
jgi:hypothetical protein